MEINRRDFIKFVVGGIAGIHVTPLPWKLTDDIAIWTQNWPWVPVPGRGEFKEAKSICTLCPGGCGIRLRLVEKRGVKIESRDEFPVNHGGICPIGMGGLQLMYDKDLRFTSPMKRAGQRGEGIFVDISWDEAYSILVQRLKELREKKDPRLLAAVDGLPYEGSESLMVRRFMQAFGSNSYFRLPDQDLVDRTVNWIMHGIKGSMGFDLENSDYILSFGAGLLEGWGIPGRILNLWGEWKARGDGAKVKVVQIESRASNTASKADRWIAIKPGTEAALALGIVRELIQRGRYNVDFVNEHTFGFGDWVDQEGKSHKGFRSMVMEAYTPEKVAQITGIDPKEIKVIATELESAKAPVAIWGRGRGELPSGVYETMAIHSINIVLGRIQRPGGVIVSKEVLLGDLGPVLTDEKAKEALRQGTLVPAGIAEVSHLADLVKAILDSKEPVVDTLLLFQANPWITMPSSILLEKALKKVPFIVSFSPFRDDTSCYADLILPDHAYLEKFQEMVNPKGLGYAAYCISAPVLPNPYSTKALGDILIQLAGKLGGAIKESFPFKSYEEVLKQRTNSLFSAKRGSIKVQKEPPWKWVEIKDSGIQGDDKKDWETLLKSNIWYQPNTKESAYIVFPTESKKVELMSLSLKRFRDAVGAKTDEDLMPQYRGLETEKAGLLFMPYEMVNWSSGWAPSPPYLTKTIFDHILLKQDLFMELNPTTAKELGLREGEMVEVKSKLGVLQLKVHLSEVAMPGVAYAPLGFGRIGYDEFLKSKGVNVARILTSQKDPIVGTPLWWGTRVTINRV